MKFQGKVMKSKVREYTQLSAKFKDRRKRKHIGCKVQIKIEVLSIFLLSFMVFFFLIETGKLCYGS